MPDIVTTLLPFSDGATINAPNINKLTYAPTTGTPESFEVINGQLDLDNTKSTFSVSHDMVRPRSLVGGVMVGLTGNLDYTPPIFAEKNTDDDAYIAIPGASLSFHLPVDASLVIFTWQVGGANAIKFEEDALTRMKFHLSEGGEAPVSRVGIREIGPSRHGCTSDTHKALRRPHRDRVWSGHFSKTNLAAGWHHAAIVLHNDEQTIRIRVRNMKVIWFA